MRSCVVSMLLLAACGGSREPGPLSSEHGAVLFWEVSSLGSSVTSCTDAPDYASATEPPALDENSYLIYRLSEDGTSALLQSCTETRASSCSDGDLTFAVDGHTLTTSVGPSVVTTVGACEIANTQAWTLTDEGNTAALTVATTFAFSGDANDCDAADDVLANGGTNGFGLSECEVTLTAELDFATAD